jgi:diguanylate cyclase (GGDEF)-like protein
MKKKPAARLVDLAVLIVDDEENICALLAEVLQQRFSRVDVSYSAGDGIRRILAENYDIVVTDLKLPDVWGIEVLKAAKAKDEFVEVIVITGYGTLESASEAINLGVTSYLTKPLSINEFTLQIEKAAATRAFHLKSLLLMKQSDRIVPEVVEHLHDITNLYYFSRKLMLGLDIPEIMRTILYEAGERLAPSITVIGIKSLDFCEIFAMPRTGCVTDGEVRDFMLRQWDSAWNIIDRTRFEQNEIALHVFKGRDGERIPADTSRALSLPMSVLGNTFGFISLGMAETGRIKPEDEQFMHVFVSMISSVIEHGYRDLHAKQQAKTDSLTGIANHRMMHETLEREITRADRHKRTFCFALVDIDDFKTINDTSGHLVGDAVLIDLTRRIVSHNRRGDFLARYGGEEFALVLPDTPLCGGEVLARRLCEEISARPFVFSRESVSYTISIGLTEYNGEFPRTKDRLFADADQALYDSKKNGKNRVSTR